MALSEEDYKLLAVGGSIGAAAIAAVVSVFVAYIGHRLTRTRDQDKQRQEKLASEAQRKTDLQFISTGLIFELEGFAQRCYDVIADYTAQRAEEPASGAPALRLESVQGDWIALPPSLMYRIRELPIAYQAAVQTAAGMRAAGGLMHMTTEFRMEIHAKAGLKAIRLARRLRRESGFPDTRLAGGPFSIHAIMWRLHRRCVKVRAWDYVIPSPEARPSKLLDR